jgi:hypothetical protein
MTYEEKKEAFLKLFANDPEINKIPLPDSIREKLSIYQDISYTPITVAVNKCLFSGNRYDGYEERKPVDPDFPDLTKLAKEEAKIEICENKIERS